MRAAAVVAGVGQTTYYKWGQAPEPEFKLALRAILAATDQLLDSARAEGEPLTGRLRLGVIPTVAPYLLPPVVKAVREAHPELVLLLHEDQTDRKNRDDSPKHHDCTPLTH